MDLSTLIQNEYEKDEKRRENQLKFLAYQGQIYTDQYLIDNFPLKLKVKERLAQLKNLLFFLASTYNISDVKNNRGIFFTKNTFLKAGMDISGQQRSNWIKGMKRCGLLYVVNNHYQFNHGDENFCKLYGLNQYGIIKSFPKEYQEYLETHKSVVNPDSVVKISDDILIDVFNKKEKQTVRGGLTASNEKPTEDYDKQKIVDFTKGTISDFKRMLDEYNEDKSEFNRKTLHFKCDGNKITGRAYSKYISTEKDDFYATNRTVWCEQNGLKYRYDIKSAVPRISHLLATGEWKGPDFDFYQAMIDMSGLNFSRDYMKSVHMRLRFGKTPEKSFSEFCFSNSNLIKKHYPSGMPYEEWLSVVRPRIFEDWKKLFSICEQLEGSDHSSSVFYFESYLELYVVWKLKQMGVTAYNIYDEFFYDKECDISSIIAEAANYMYTKVGI